MKVNDRDGQILQHIVIYCDEVNNTIKRFGNNKRSFETALRLSDDFLKESTDIPWRAIKGMRNMFAHEYGKQLSKIFQY